jgi:hypothetical protein
MTRTTRLALLAVLLAPLTAGSDYRPDHRAIAPAKAPVVGRAKWYSQFDPQQYADANPHVVSIIYLRPLTAAPDAPAP